MLKTILAATDDSEEGRAAVAASARLGARVNAKVVVLTVAQASDEAAKSGRTLIALREGVERLLRGGPTPRIEYLVEYGLPGIEIARTAETVHADMIVVGRKRRTSMQRLMVGDTADSVARRSRVPCLFVSCLDSSFGRLLVGLDGTERGISVLPVAMDFARDAGSRVRFVTVEQVMDEGDLGADWDHAPRSKRLADALEAYGRKARIPSEAWESRPGDPAPALAIHRGRIVDEILKEVRHTQADVLVIGCHRGGPAGTLEAGSISRRLMHTCHCAVMTVPL